LFAQTNVSGSVTDAKTGEALVGASVLIKGTTTGAVTDLDGNFKISLPAKDAAEYSLVVSYLGYVRKEVTINGASFLTIKLAPDTEQLNEVIVTAFGVKQEKKAINYSVQEIDSKDIVESRQDNLVSALQGKVAGVQITNTSGSPGASSSILIRGANSLDESISNQPLFVVDGIPVSNSSAFGGTNRAFDINPNDIASMTVLKGGAAAALYGLEAANGAVIITTKRGKAGESTINFSTGVSVDRAFRTSPRQQKYIQGNVGVFDNESTSNWGPQKLPNQEVYDNVNNFLEYGIRQKYDLSISGGSEKLSGYISGNYLDHKGVFPGEQLQRYGLLLKGTNQVNDRLSISSSVNFISSENVRSGFGTMANIYRWPINDDMSQYLNPDGTKKFLIERPLGEEWRNPENPNWRAENNPITDDVNRVILLNTVEWSILDDLKFTYRLGGDFTDQHYKSITRPGTTGSVETFNGIISETERFANLITSTALLSYNKTFSEKFTVSALLGQNVQISNSRNTSIRGLNYRNPLLDNINNLQTFDPPSQNISRRRIVGVFGDVKIDYNGMVYLGVTARNDWTSTLPAGNNSFFYPSVSAGVVFTEFIPRNEILTFGKLRASYAQIGKDAPAHRTDAYLEPYNGINGGFKYDFFAGNRNLVPEITTTWEVGTDLRFLNGSLGVDFSYYEMVTNDMIITSRVSTASGWVQLVFNAGSLQNRGMELVLDYEALNIGDLQWNVLANFSGNRSKVIDLPESISRLPVTSGQVISAARPSSLVNEPLLALEGSTYLYNELGQLVLDENGRPRIGSYIQDSEGNYELNPDGTRKIDGTNVYLGNREPKAIIGITNSLTYKNFNLSFLFDIRIGGDVLNAAEATMIGNGSAGYLEQYRNKSTVFEGVVETEAGFQENTNEIVLDQSFFNDYAGVGTNFIQDASWTRLRYITLGYNLPQVWAQKIGATRFNISATARNLALWTKYSGGDPETNYAGAGVGGVGTIGLDYFNVPAVQGVDLTLNITF
jgi:TonB-linked SusC/RagA family outer membrane protein